MDLNRTRKLAGLPELKQKTLTEGRKGSDLQELIEKYFDMEGVNNFEGERGVRALEKLFKVLGYNSLNAFFSDNSGAIEAVIEWIGKFNSDEWEESLMAIVPNEDEDEDE